MSDQLFEHKEMTGFIFKNEAPEGKTLHENAPAYKGKCLINGAIKEISIWKSEAGKKHVMNFKIQDEFKAKPEPIGEDLP